MDTRDYLKLGKKSDKTTTEIELLKSERALRIISEIVTDATKNERSTDESIAEIRTQLDAHFTQNSKRGDIQ